MFAPEHRRNHSFGSDRPLGANVLFNGQGAIAWGREAVNHLMAEENGPPDAPDEREKARWRYGGWQDRRLRKIERI
jgi:hypothetical protein